MSPATLVRFMRPATVAAPITGVVGGAVAAAGAWPQDGTAVWAAIGSAVLLTGASNGINQIADVETDRINRPAISASGDSKTNCRYSGRVVHTWLS